jgi:HK97 family phage portal protein
MSGYGVSELEELVSVVTSLVWGEEYNRRFFKQGSAPKGILRISGSMPDHKLNEFRQNWNSTMRGVQNAHRTPVLEAEKADWIDLQRNNRDMEFTQWMEFLIKVACAIYTIDPSEINFPMSGSAGSSPMFGENKESTLKFSQMKGLYPILKFLQKRINKYLIQPRNPKYEFAFVGLDAMTPKEQAELDEKSVKTYKTVNELRKEKNLKPLPGGDILLDSTFARAVNAEKQRQMMDDSQGYEDGGAGAEEAIISGKYPGGEAEEELDKNNPIIKSLEEFLIGINTK